MFWSHYLGGCVTTSERERLHVGELVVGSMTPQPIAVEWSTTTISDALLVTNAQLDRAAFTPLYDRYFATMFRFCYYRLGDWQEAEDAASEVFTRALANLSRFQSDQHLDGFRCWLFAIARHVVTDRHRDVARHPAHSLDHAAGIFDGAPTPEEAALADESHRQVRLLLSRLKPAQRDLLELRLAGLKNAEIARILGRSHDAVRKEQSRIVQTLRLFVNLEAEQELSNG